MLQTTDNMAHSHCMLIPRATTAQTGCVILITFPLQQWLYEHTSVLRYTYIACPMFILNTCNIQFLKLYRTVIRPIVTFASETWVLKENIIHKLLDFERKILTGIFGLMKENQIWRIKNKDELDKLIKHENIVNYINPFHSHYFYPFFPMHSYFFCQK